MVLARQLPGGGVQLSIKGIRIAYLAGALASYVDRPVVDRTGTVRLYDVLMNFDNQAPGISDTPSDLPTIYEALKKAGLQLTRAQGAVEVVVVDRLERPSEN